MVTVSRQVELTVQIRRGPVALGHLIAALNSCGAHVLVAHSHETPTGTTVRLVTDNAPRTTHALEGMDLRPTAEPVVLMELPDQPGLIARLGAKLTAAGIQVLYSYSFHSERWLLYAVFRTSDDHRAVYLLEVDGLIHDVAAALSLHAPVPAEAHAA